MASQGELLSDRALQRQWVNRATVEGINRPASTLHHPDNPGQRTALTTTKTLDLVDDRGSTVPRWLIRSALVVVMVAGH